MGKVLFDLYAAAIAEASGRPIPALCRRSAAAPHLRPVGPRPPPRLRPAALPCSVPPPPPQQRGSVAPPTSTAGALPAPPALFRAAVGVGDCAAVRSSSGGAPHIKGIAEQGCRSHRNLLLRWFPNNGVLTVVTPSLPDCEAVNRPIKHATPRDVHGRRLGRSTNAGHREHEDRRCSRKGMKA